MNNKKPLPLVTSPPRRICPVCGQSSYSSAGIHPQCAMFQADKARRACLAAEKKALVEGQEEDQEKTDEHKTGAPH